MTVLLDEDMQCMKKDWEHLVSVAPRFMGTAGEREAVDYIVEQIKKAGLSPVLQTFYYEGWQLNKPAELFMEEPEYMKIETSVLLGSGGTQNAAVQGTVVFIGETIIWNMYEWMRFGIVDENGELVGYISGRPDGQAISQTLAEGNSALPHFAIGMKESQMLIDYMKEYKTIKVRGTLDTSKTGKNKGSNIRVLYNSTNTAAEKILICAHYDTMFNTLGAYDNASGVAVLLSLVALLKKYDIQKNIELVFMGAEEWNLTGSDAYVKHLVATGKEKVDFVINIDGLGRGDRLEAWVGPEKVERELLSFFNDVYKRDIYVKTPPPPGSDHTPFYNSGIPVCMFTINDQEIIHSSNDILHESIFTNMREFIHILVELLKNMGVVSEKNRKEKQA